MNVQMMLADAPRYDYDNDDNGRDRLYDMNNEDELSNFINQCL